MMSRTAVNTKYAPAAPPNASQGIICNRMVHCSGNLAFEAGTTDIISGGIRAETRQVIQNLSAILQEAGSSLASVVKVNIFLTSMDDFKAMNEVYDEFFAKCTQKPCRTCVAVYQLAFGAKVEMDCSAVLSVNSKL